MVTKGGGKADKGSLGSAKGCVLAKRLEPAYGKAPYHRRGSFYATDGIHYSTLLSALFANSSPWPENFHFGEHSYTFAHLTIVRILNNFNCVHTERIYSRAMEVHPGCLIFCLPTKRVGGLAASAEWVAILKPGLGDLKEPSYCPAFFLFCSMHTSK